MADQEAISRILGQMERLRLDSLEAESVTETRRLMREYDRLWRIVEPMLSERATTAKEQDSA